MCISRFTANEAELLGVPRDRILTISPGIDPAPYFDVSVENVEALRSRFSLFGKKIILTLARLDVRKGHDMVVRSLPAIVASVSMLTTSLLGKAIPQEYLPSRRNSA